MTLPLNHANEYRDLIAAQLKRDTTMFDQVAAAIMGTIFFLCACTFAYAAPFALEAWVTWSLYVAAGVSTIGWITMLYAAATAAR